MTFEEKFRNKWLEVFKDACRKNEEEVIKNWLDKNCIDKQRVREVIDRLKSVNHWGKPRLVILEELKKELGL